MREFSKFHPIVTLMFFVMSIGFAMFFQNPICIGIALVCAIIYSYITGGVNTLKFNFILSAPIVIISGGINTLFNHRGDTIIAYFPNGDPVTMEAIVYGFLVGGMISTVVSWFSCYNKVMTEDKFIYLFGRVSPSIALTVSMTLRFVPQFIEQFKKVTEAQRCIGRDIKKGKIKDRVITAAEITSVMTTWALERSIATSDSMHARGYGRKKRTAFSIYKFSLRDVLTLIYMVIIGTYIITGIVRGAVDFQCMPHIEINMTGADVYISYFLLLIFPVIIEIKEGWKWKLLRRKI